mgnify:CR=1 FL=1
MTNQYDFAVVGGGAVGQETLKHASECANVRVVGVVEPDAANGAKLKERFGVPVYGSLDALLNARPDCVKICSPNALHAEQTIACLQHGCHVLVEKPMASSIEDCRRMVEAEKASRRLLMVNFEYRLSAVFAKVREIITQGLVGDVRNAFLYESRGPFEGRRGNWRYTNEGGSGLVPEKLVHYIDLMHHFTGSPAAAVTGVHGPPTIRHYEFADNGFLFLRHLNGARSVIGTFHGVQPDWSFRHLLGKAQNHDTLPHQRRERFMARYGHRDFLQLTGTKGSIDADMVHATVAVSRYVPCDRRGGQATQAGPHYDFSHLPWAETIHNQTGMLDHFFSCVRGTESPVISSNEALETMAASFAARTALEEQTSVDVPVTRDVSGREPNA